MANRMRETSVSEKIIVCLTIVSFIFIILNVIKIYQWKVKVSTYNITLLGDNPLTVYQDDKYVESGFVAKNYLNKETNNLVEVNSDVNTKVIGKYKVVYEITNFFKKNKVVREVNVEENPLEDVKFTLKGKDKININRTTIYKEDGFNVVSDKGDFTKNVIIKNNVDTNKVGTYEIIYTLRIGNKEKSIKRIVNVIGDKYSVSLSNTNWTNNDIKIKVESHLKDFDYFINPNGVKVNKETFEFTVDKNGTYEYHLIDKFGIDEVIKVDVNTIDKLKPSGVCNSFISQNKTTYSLNVRDVSGIKKIVHNDIEYDVNTFVIDEIEDIGMVSVYDNAGNVNDMECTVEYEYISPLNHKYMYKYESYTLKYWLEKFENYTTTHIWVKDAYNQLKIGIPPKLGTLYTAKGILNNEIKNNNYEEKGMVAINASGIVGGGFGTEYINIKPSWVGTAAIPLVIVDGKVIRDSTNQEIPDVNYLTYGLKKDGYLEYYKYGKGNDVEYNLGIKDKIINDGVKNTFGFSPVLVLNNTVKVGQTDNNIRQAICQIDRNNFVIVTNTTLVRSKGFNLKKLANYLVNLNCKIGYNLDGGGSVNHYYKGNDKTIYSINNSTRGLVDILYFVEK